MTTIDDLYQKHDGAIPEHEMQPALFGNLEIYLLVFLRRAEKRFTQRCLQIVRATSAWRLAFLYPEKIRKNMLVRMQKALCQARMGALEARCRRSNTSITAPPHNTMLADTSIHVINPTTALNEP